ncbi:MAG: penicillin acylase family protein, partial [Verrucomicrobia bacterium]|nr:penicillin acylase family protein [Verrucomicrobiota bacterium]
MPVLAKPLRLLAAVGAALVLATVIAGGWCYFRLRASRPQLEGSASLPGLSAAVAVERDVLGVPAIRGENRPDVARALGWLHAQDRFFQMDLLRRAAAGELAELFGRRALPRDRAVRRHGFRKLAGRAVAGLEAPQRALLETYTAGVNAGLAALGERPFEYLVLRTPPQPWRSEDCLLVGYAMFLDLQDEAGGYEHSLMILRDTYGLGALAFLAPLVGPADAALDGSTAPLPPIPGPKVINVRAQKVGAASRASAHVAAESRLTAFPFPEFDPEATPGSNAFALAGTHTASGAGLLASDPHLGHAVPNIWYRAVLSYAGRRVVGATLPGLPLVVAGSNGDVAWGCTNAYADTGDLVAVETNSIARHLYKAPGHDDFLAIESRQETFQVRGEKAVTAEYDWTIWGPIIGTNDRQRPLVYRWIAHDAEAVNLQLLDVEHARTIDDALAVAHRAGMPHQNFILADRTGGVAWTLAGRLPRRAGYDGRLPVTWSFGDRRWDGYLSPAEVPVVRGPESILPGKIWSAN